MESIATALVKTDAIQFGTFTLPDNRQSSYYINLRGLPSFPGAYRVMTDAFLSFVKTKVGTGRFDGVAGIPVAGLSFSSPLALALGKPMIYVRTGREADRAQRMVEGFLKPGWRILIVDDLVTSGTTISSSAATIRQEGGEVKDALVLIDRMEGARERLSKQGIRLHSITDILEISDFLFSKNLINEDNLKAITKQIGGAPSSRP